MFYPRVNTKQRIILFFWPLTGINYKNIFKFSLNKELESAIKSSLLEFIFGSTGQIEKVRQRLQGRKNNPTWLYFTEIAKILPKQENYFFSIH